MAYTGTGVARYVSGMTKALLKAGSTHQFVLIAGALQQRKFFTNLANSSEYKGIEFRILPLPPKLARHLLKFPVLNPFIKDLDLLHTSDWAEPFTSCPRVTTVHDLVFHKYPETVDKEVLQAQTTRLIRIVKSGTHIIADSQSTKNDLKEIYHLADDQIDVVYPAIDSAYCKVESNKIDQVKSKYGISGRYILSVGTQEPRKNLTGIIEAYTDLKNDPSWQDVALVVTGKYGWGDKIAPVQGMVATGYVDEVDLPALYSGADVFVYPSFYEGFGFPVLESIACGTPVVTSNISSLPELAGHAAVLVDPNDHLAIAAGITEAYKQREALIASGLERASELSWARSAEQIIRIYEKVVANAKK